MFVVEDDKLSRYNPGDDPRLLFEEFPDLRLYPVIVAGKVLAEIGLSRESGKWEPHDFYTEGFREINVLRAARSESGQDPVDSIAYVNIPAVNMTFVAEPANPATTSGGVRLTPLGDDWGWKAGNAQQVFAKLAPFARMKLDSINRTQNSGD